MNFENALERMKAGMTLTRKAWGPKRKTIRLSLGDFVFGHSVLRLITEDILAEDWEIVV